MTRATVCVRTVLSERDALGCPNCVEVTGCTIKDGGHCWFGDAACGTGVLGLGNLIVGNNSDFLNASDAAWTFLKRLRR